MFRTLLTISLTIMLLSCILSETKINQKTDLLFTEIKQFQMKPRLCQYKEGLDCRNLRLGDEYHSTKEMERGYLYSCDGKNPSAPGSIQERITWINFPKKTWNILKKLWLPEGDFRPTIGMYSERLDGSRRIIEINNLPKDGYIGDWPMSNYKILNYIDRNPGIPSSKNLKFVIPSKPNILDVPKCLSLGPVGVTTNGVVIYNASDARGNDAVAHEIVDVFGGHPARDEYHYHFIPERFDKNSLEDGHSGKVGYIIDGFPIYGYKGSGGKLITNKDLDICHGHAHGELGYHYHATLDYPYTVGCFRGDPFEQLNGLKGRRLDRPLRKKD